MGRGEVKLFSLITTPWEIGHRKGRVIAQFFDKDGETDLVRVSDILVNAVPVEFVRRVGEYKHPIKVKTT